MLHRPWASGRSRGGPCHFSPVSAVMEIGHYLPLDGTVFKDSRSVDTEPFVGAGSLGFAVRHGGFAVSLAMSFSTDAFETQTKDGRVRHPERVLVFLTSSTALT